MILYLNIMRLSIEMSRNDLCPGPVEKESLKGMVRTLQVRTRMDHNLIVVFVLAVILNYAGNAYAENGDPRTHEKPRIPGSVRNALEKPLSGVRITILRPDRTVVARTVTDSRGLFWLPDLPPGHYLLKAERTGYRLGLLPLDIPRADTVPIAFVLASREALSLRVSAKKRTHPRSGYSEATGTGDYRIDHADIHALPQGENTPLNQVLLQAPGIAQDSFGQIHVRGEHGNLQYRLNGVLLPPALNDFSQAFDTRFLSSVDLLTGALPAQYGFWTAGVVDMHTKNGAFRNGGDFEVYGGSHNTLEPSFQMEGSSGKTSYYFNGTFLTDELGIENPAPTQNAIHDRTVQGKAFVYLSREITPDTKLTFIAGNSTNQFQIPDYPDVAAAFTLNGITSFNPLMLNENQFEQNSYGLLALNGSTEKWDYQLSVFTFYNTTQYMPDYGGDLIFDGIASDVFLSAFTNGVEEDTSYRVTRTDTLRFGLYGNAEIGGINNTSAVFPGGPGFQTSNVPFSIVANQTENGWLGGLYLTNEWRILRNLILNTGLRFDMMDQFVTANQLSPRINLTYKPTRKLTLHAGFSRYFVPPDLETENPVNPLLFNGTSGATPVTTNSPVLPERSSYYDVGATYAITDAWQVGLDSYYTDVQNMIDEGQFGQAFIFSQFNYAYGQIKGLEFTTSYKKDKLMTYLNGALSNSIAKNVVSSQFNFAPDELAYIANNWIHTDHNQILTASGGVAYDWATVLWNADFLYGSGLQAGFANTLNLPPYFQLNLGAVREANLPVVGRIQGRVSILNALDTLYILRSGTGIGVFAPQYGPMIAVYTGISKIF
jgi:outer membrane receptor protein involved in Fe transport